MKLLKLTLFFLFSMFTSMWAQNSMVIKNTEAGPAENAKIIIGLNNTSNVAGFQVKIKLPNDLVVKEKEVKFIGRNTNHVIYPNALGNGEYLFLCFSATNDNLTGNSGDLFEIPIEIPLSYIFKQTYPMTFTQAIVSSSTGVDIGSNHQNGTLKITEGKNPDVLVKNITFSQNDILPNSKYTVNWEVENIGKAAAINGWREQISLVAQNGRKYLIGNAFYNSPLTENITISRTAELDIPAIIGFDGNVKIEVSLYTNPGEKEPLSKKENNTAQSVNNANLLRRLIFTIDKNEIIENTTDRLRLNIARSGELNTEETFEISSDVDGFGLPTNFKIKQNESSNFLYIKPTDNLTYEGDRTVKLTVKGNGYNDEKLNFNLLDDEEVILNLSYPQDYTSTIGSKILFTLNANFSKNTDQVINIATNQAKRLQLPPTVTIPAGIKTITFEGTIVDTQAIEKTEIAIVNAKASGYTSAVKEIKLNSINVPIFTLSISPNKISESDGIKATYATLKRTTNIDKQAVVQISANVADQLILPTEIAFQKNQTERIFNIGVVNNAIVEGERIVTVASKVRFDSCNCTDDSDTASIVKEDITIVDNDGLALNVAISPSTVKAGTQSVKLTISRNTTNAAILANPVTVTLSSSITSVVELPSSITIPAGSKELQTTFNTKIDPNLTGDQSLRIQAEAPSYAVGFGWLLVSDQNKADIEITKVETPITTLTAGQKINVTTSIKNQGNVTVPPGYKLDYYISKNNSIAGLKPFVSSIIQKSVAIGTTILHTEELQLPNLSGNVYLIAVANGDQSISELTNDNNQNQTLITVLPAYSVTINLNKQVYATNETVIVTGVAKNTSGIAVQNTEVSIKIKNKEFERTYDVKTDANGNFIYEYKPLTNETGTYTVAAGFPGEDIAPQKSFDLLGFEIIGKPQYVKWETLAGVPLGKELVLKNKTNTKLTGVTIVLPPDADFSIDQTPVDIEAGATVTFPYKVVSTTPSKEVKYYEHNIAVTSTEGAKYKEIIYYYAKAQEAKLEVNPLTINTTMAKGTTRLYEFTIKNVGAVDAENVEVLLPQLAWMRLNSQKVIEKIKAGEEVKIVLELEPTVKEQVNVPLTGTLVAKQKVGAGLQIPYRITTVSEATGKLIVDATDEYTFNTAAAPHLKGAKVTVKQPYTGVIVAEGITDNDGLFTIPNIPEGWYTVDVAAEKHNPYQNNILVDPGRDTKVNAFLSYQAVTYSWNVVPTDVIDEYDIKIVTQFETNVPKPVVVMELDNPKLDLKVGESRLTYITITNHGLIAANKITINPGELEGYTMKPLITSLDVLNAKSTVVVPVLVKNESDLSNNKMAKMTSGGGGCSVGIALTGYYFCDVDKMLSAQVVYFKVKCPTPPPITGPTGPGPVGGTPCTLGGCPWAAAYPTLSVSTGIDACEPCTKKLIGTVLKCGKIALHELTFFSCAYGLYTATSLFDLGLGAISCVNPYKKIKIAICVFSILQAIYECVPSGGGSSSKSPNLAPMGKFDYIYQDFKVINDAKDATDEMLSEYLKNSEFENDNPDLGLFLQEVYDQVDNEKSFTSEDIVRIKNNLRNTSIKPLYIDEFTTRWNRTMIAWGQNIFSPNATSPNIVDKIKINQYKDTKAELVSHTFKRGFVSVSDMYESGINALEEYTEEKSKDQASVCASVTLEFPQRLTMTRDAFEGTLKIKNSSDKTIKDVNLDLIVKDENGENKTYLFQINKDAFLNGTGLVNPNADGLGKAIFIPTKEAAPTVKQSYSFGGTLSYFDPSVNDRVTVNLNPVTLEVNPSPDLVLHYFMQRDILGDDSLTPDTIEPTIPAELSLMINNDGYGVARNVNVESAQPRIIDNDKGLLVDFKMIGSNFNNEPRQLGLLNVDFGNIEAKQSAIGQWYFTSSLIGHFIKYDVKVVHKSNFGNNNLSLIKAAYIHELIKSVKSYGTGSDNIDDFLVNDIADATDTPDQIFLSNGTSEEVKKSESIQIINTVTASTLTSKIKLVPATTGWNYNNIVYPEATNYEITKVVRDNDNFEVPLKNVWQTYVTLKDGLNPKYENKLHILDKISDITTYTIYYKPIDGNIPEVELFVDAPAKNNATPVTLVKVRFNKEIDVNTFLKTNIQLTSQGAILPSDKILIGKIDAKTYSINITELTKTSGFYELLVKTVGIKDLLGNEGRNGKKIEWLQFINELGILKFETDQVKKQPVNTIKVIFNKPIRAEEFTTDKVTVNNLPVANLSIQKVDEYNYTLSGFSTANPVDGNYQIAIDVTKITAVDGTKGLVSQTYDWKVDNILPKVVKLQTISQGVSNNQNITEIDMEINRKLTTPLETSALSFTKNGQALNIPVIIEKIDDLHYKLLGLGSFTAQNGDYRLVINQTAFKDENDNSGVGNAETSWSVRIVAIDAIAGLKITPDRGSSNTDNITAGKDVKLVYKTLMDNLNVEIYELNATSEILIDKQFKATAGEYDFLLTEKFGAKKFKVVGVDASGNRSNAQIITTYIDFTDIVTELKPVNNNSNDCTDFDFVNVNFTEDIKENTFTKNAITLKSAGKQISNNDLIITKVSDKKYVLENFVNPTNGAITLEIDKTKIEKKLTGALGETIETVNLGSPNTYPTTITGDKNPIIGDIYTYSSSVLMNKYDWIIVNGEIIATQDNTVTVKWNKTGEQLLVLRYQTPLDCTLTTYKDVTVIDNNLGLNPVNLEKNTIAPVPNNGQFTIHTNKVLNDCTITVFNTSGKLVYQEEHVKFDQKMKTVNTNLQPGIYILILNNSQEKLQFKFLVE